MRIVGVFNVKRVWFNEWRAMGYVVGVTLDDGGRCEESAGEFGSLLGCGETT